MRPSDFYDCQEAIYRGEPCIACGVAWDGTSLEHLDGCEYIKQLNEYGDDNDGE